MIQTEEARLYDLAVHVLHNGNLIQHFCICIFLLRLKRHWSGDCRAYVFGSIWWLLTRARKGILKCLELVWFSVFPCMGIHLTQFAVNVSKIVTHMFISN